MPGAGPRRGCARAFGRDGSRRRASRFRGAGGSGEVGGVPGAEMECEAERPPLGVFKCQLCALTAPYSYVGQKPPDTQSIVLLEESYVMKDPFTPDKGRFLVLGSRCSLCSRLVCVGPECSLFYSKRFCLPCVRENLDAFPREIQQDVERRKGPSKKPVGQPGSGT
ncbi:cysteine-rich DPF motif domain-containing protein 1 isoform X1 [Suricata suricatta]|nr:cysteine-rich DPF motif domain-containing protein 1 isoform X1 [Suricata suricatta]